LLSAAGSIAIGVLHVSVSPSRVSTRRTLLPRVGAEVPIPAEAGVRTEGKKEGAGGSAQRQQGADVLTNLSTVRG